MKDYDEGTRFEWAYCSRWPDGTEHLMRCTSEMYARAMVAQGSPDPTITRTLVHRKIHVEPWQPPPALAPRPTPGA